MSATSVFEMDRDWLSFDPAPSKPRFQLPPGAVDAHCHVFGPGHVFPYAHERKYTPCDAGKEQLWALRDHLGFSRNVIVQATCHGADNRAMIDAVSSSNGLARGVATVRSDVSEGELEEMHAAGVRGVRFNFVKRLVDMTPRADLERVAAKIAPLGWHVVVYYEAPDLAELSDFFTSLPTVVVIDHMGRPDVSQTPEHPDFQRFLHLLEAHPNIWTKLSCAERLTVTGPPYADFLPFASRCMERFSDRVLCGTDWPHPNLKRFMPDDGELVDLVPKFAATPQLQQKLLVDNPMRLYWGEQPPV